MSLASGSSQQDIPAWSTDVSSSSELRSDHDLIVWLACGLLVLSKSKKTRQISRDITGMVGSPKRLLSKL